MSGMVTRSREGPVVAADDLQVDIGPLERKGTFEELFERERPVMLRIAYLITRSTGSAEEVTHDAFVQVYERWDQLERPGGYLRRCVVNRAARHKRKSDRTRLQVVPEQPATQDYDHTYEALGTLSPRARAMVVLRYYASMSQAEIAATLEVPIGTVKSGLHNALAELRKVLS